MNSNQRKAAALGMPFGTANSQLRKSLLFKFVKELGYDNCYRCEKSIETIEEFSIEHKVAWFNTKNPVESFFDLENISFSHMSCNYRAAARPNKVYASSLEQHRASSARWYDKPDNRESHLKRKRERYAESKK